ncbi:uncharacterized protein BO97DRAFT_271426 [Aspergillus homomorphus CBS 101889]|uniref:Uncharacterized protein n=1 Tax=Aspergillus homomorphus (strain CBS 101889) TaxID=1450537 RepID=A0A395I8N8_ASPHC|nr:hypothetical protein BO97DRAFT_271426 [Aspergillus homomorphus CBS 101889]RAL14504.1 hypothetical protein BO97DRAFT_271426 [Aspergillus homomorphus CBS 101889]
MDGYDRVYIAGYEEELCRTLCCPVFCFLFQALYEICICIPMVSDEMLTVAAWMAFLTAPVASLSSSTKSILFIAFFTYSSSTSSHSCHYTTSNPRPTYHSQDPPTSKTAHPNNPPLIHHKHDRPSTLAAKPTALLIYQDDIIQARS